jgi:hypothetical protein
MQSSRALPALPVVLWLGFPALLAAQARFRVTTDGAWFYQEAAGKRLARLARGVVLVAGSAEGDWLNLTIEGWIVATSVGPTPRAGFDLAVTRAPEENLRSAPGGALVGKLPEGFLLTRVDEGSDDRWIHVTRAGWVETATVEPVVRVAGTRTADSDMGPTAGAPAPAAQRAPAVAGAPAVGPPDRAPAPAAQRAPAVAGAPVVDPPDSGADPPPDPGRIESARRTVLYRAPEGVPAGTLAPSAPLRVLGRSGDWVRVEVQGWVKNADLQIAPPGVLVGVTAAELRTDPQRYVGQMLRWTLQYIAIQKADELRPDIPNGATYMLARGPLPERGFVYVVVPEMRRAQLEALTPLATIQATARVRAGRSRFLGNPVVDLVSLETLP